MAQVSQGSGDGEDEMISGINVTPLVDVTLVLLIIFMVTTSYIVRQTIEVNLPRAANGGDSLGETLMIVVRADGTTVVDGSPMNDEALRARVREARTKDPEAKAIIAGDQDARHGAVVHAIDVVKGEGITKFGLNIEKEASPGEPPSPEPVRAP